MKYISVTSPGTEMSLPIFNRFDSYLVSLGEAATSPNWKESQVKLHMKKIISTKPKECDLYIDSGGFQIIMNYVTEDRIGAYIEMYHKALEDNREDIQTIFSLDVWNPSFIENADLLYYYNRMSCQQSVDLIKKYPDIADKQLFVLQTSNSETLETWRKMLLDPDLNIISTYNRWSVGGLVGLKKSTNAKFSHALAATLWINGYLNAYNGKIDQMHWLGQSSRLSFITMQLCEKLIGINMTSDSSQLVRFAPLDQKLPYLIQDDEIGFRLISNKDEVIKYMFNKHSVENLYIYATRNNEFNIKQLKGIPLEYKEINTIQDFHEAAPEESVFKMSPLLYFEITGRLDNVTFIEFQSQNLKADLEFGKIIGSIIYEKLDVTKTYCGLKIEDLHSIHPVLKRGRIAKELMNNLEIIHAMLSSSLSGDVKNLDEIMFSITDSYINKQVSKQQKDNAGKILTLQGEIDDIIEIEQNEIKISNEHLCSYNDNIEIISTYTNNINKIKLIDTSILNTEQLNKLNLSLKTSNENIQLCNKNIETLSSFYNTDIKYIVQQSEKRNEKIKYLKRQIKELDTQFDHSVAKAQKLLKFL
jgi:hypothetical protein